MRQAKKAVRRTPQTGPVRTQGENPNPQQTPQAERAAKTALRQQAVLPAADLASDCFEMMAAKLRDVEKEMDAAILEGNATNVARAFVRQRDLSEQIKEGMKRFNAFHELVKTIKLPEVFDRAGVPTVNLDEARVTVSQKLQASIKGEFKEQAYEWLRKNKLGDLITDTVNASTLSAAAKAMAEENRELPEEFFNCAIMANTSVTKTKAKV